MPSDSAGNGPAVRAEDLGKCYQIYDRPQDRLKQAMFRWRRRQYYREFWALRHLGLEVKRGECVGIIGRNGSGKSTLLQIIAGTLRPSEGCFQVQGRVAALLELGSGFNAEFTGRENVLTNAALLGIPRSRVEEQFPEIAAFAEIGDFIEQPIKTYSSGMVVRLAFAVQVLLEPDVLIIDEALSVGDEAFQRKCFAWLERFRDSGKTILFVTHSAQLVVQLCNRAFLLDHGELLASGKSKPVVDAYQKMLYGTQAEAERLKADLRKAGGRVDELAFTARSAPAGSGLEPAEDTAGAQYDEQMIRPAEISYGNGQAQILSPAMYDRRGKKVNVVISGQRYVWRYRVRFSAEAQGVTFGMMIKTVQGIDVIGISTGHLDARLEHAEAGQELDVQFAFTLNLAPGSYFLNSGVAALTDDGEVYLHRRVDVAAIRVLPPDERLIFGLSFSNPQCSLQIVSQGEPAHA